MRLSELLGVIAPHTRVVIFSGGEMLLDFWETCGREILNYGDAEYLYYLCWIYEAYVDELWIRAGDSALVIELINLEGGKKP